MQNKNSLDNPLYYEHSSYEKNNLGVHLRDKVKKKIELIPSNVKMIIDIGCGNGAIKNELAKKYTVTGIDRSVNALKFITTTKILSSSGKIDVLDESYEMVFSSELLEHLEDNVYYATLEETKRISKKYIFFTVPNNEILENDFIQCPYCGWIFNKTYHLTSLSLNEIKQHFTNYKDIKYIEYGSGKRG